ncbi:hypothetical protein V7S43_005738 [Phytophthora oleae]|uniref:Uncharacterized protein n=1 Tax=Phytophthora oleae TaxID=2107226 RepID=A0ABD3FR23_9STRA
MAAAADMLEKFGVLYDHRTPAQMYEYAQGADKRCINHGCLRCRPFTEYDRCILRGVPVATVAIVNPTNAGLLAVHILGA